MITKNKTDMGPIIKNNLEKIIFACILEYQNICGLERSSTIYYDLDAKLLSKVNCANSIKIYKDTISGCDSFYISYLSESTDIFLRISEAVFYTNTHEIKRLTINKKFLSLYEEKEIKEIENTFRELKESLLNRYTRGITHLKRHFGIKELIVENEDKSELIKKDKVQNSRKLTFLNKDEDE